MIVVLLRKGKGDSYERQIVLACRPKMKKNAESAVENALVKMGQAASAVRVLPAKMDKLFNELEHHKDMDIEPLTILGLGPQSELEDESGKTWIIRCYKQHNVSASRKKVVPALQQVITRVATFSE